MVLLAGGEEDTGLRRTCLAASGAPPVGSGNLVIALLAFRSDNVRYNTE